jgi:D-xylose transport system permease protein
VNVILQMAGTTMIAYGVVFVLLLGEIDLSIGYVSGICAVAVAEFQLAGSAHDFPGWIAILFGLGIVALIGLGQGAIVAKVGVPSFVVTLAGLLIFQGVILKILQSRDTILIDDNWINYTATYYFSANVGWLIAAVITGGYALVALLGVLGQRRAGLSANVGIAVLKFAGRCDRELRNRRHLQPRPEARGLPGGHPLTQDLLPASRAAAGGTAHGDLPRRPDLSRQAHDVRRHVYAVGGNAEAARRSGINVPRVRIIVFMISSVMAGVGGIILAARLQSVNLNQGGGTLLLDAISAAVIGGVSLFGGRGEVVVRCSARS